MKKFLTLLFLVCLMVPLAACGGQNTSSAAASAPASSAAPAATAAPTPTSEPLVEQEAYGIQFLLPKSITATKSVSDDADMTYYYPDADSDVTHIMFAFISLDALPPVSSWSDEDFDEVVDGLLGDEGTLLQKGNMIFRPSDPIDARYVKIKYPMGRSDFYLEYLYFANVAVSMVCEVGYDNPYTDTWESMLDSIEIVESPVESAAPASGIRPEFKEMMDSYEAFFDEYIAFMAKYKEADGTAALSMLSDLSDYMAKYTDYMSKLDAIDQNDLSPEEALYYLEVSTRIMQKLSSSLQ